jgi:lipoprotein-releasing system permease protein
MNLKPPVFIASRFLFGRKNSGHGGSGLGGAILGIGISLVPLLLVLLVSDGMIEGITKRYMETKSYHLQVALPDQFGSAAAAPAMKAIAAIKGIRSSYLEINGSAIIVSGKTSHATLVRAVSPGFYEDSGTSEYLRGKSGEIAPRNNHSIVIGSSLASALGVGLGDQVTIVSSGTDPDAPLEELNGTPAFSPRLSFFRVTGIVSAGYRELDALWAFVSLDAAERVLTPANSYEFLGIKVDKPFSNSLGTLRQGVCDALSSLYPDWFEPRLVRSWPDIEGSLYRSFSTTKSMLLYIMGIALLVAAVNLGSALATFVAERNMEIAVLRSMGADDSLIRRIFLGAGLLTGASGTLLGITFGLVLSLCINGIIAAVEWIANSAGSLFSLLSGQAFHATRLLDPGYYLEKIPISPNYPQIAAIGLLSIALCVVASIVPAVKATKISVQALVRKT